MPSSTAGGVIPAARARSFASWMTGPSITGSENGMPTSIASAPADTAASIIRCHGPRPPLRYGTRLLPPASRFERSAVSIAPRFPHPRISIICATSLSPRPDRLTSTVLPDERRPLPRHPGDGVGRFEGGDDPLGPRQQLERGDDLGVGDARVGGPPGLRPGGRARARCPG